MEAFVPPAQTVTPSFAGNTEGSESSTTHFSVSDHRRKSRLHSDTRFRAELEILGQYLARNRGVVGVCGLNEDTVERRHASVNVHDHVTAQ